ncbi:MAG: NAD-dependent epimerase/dehydratase family protein [Deltaproteobacteria bacterium]|nr:NAD-dependent epimerase/dehydratase family protein [Deltaproteobacteria bacterium]MBI4797048.1 NAD-dependent epimerase/dehydratase family protein [Deltaproteobacteria bacterium]
MRVLILGGDGYLGWATAMYLSRRGSAVAVVDNYFRRCASTELNREPLLPIPNLHQRAALWEAVSGFKVDVHIGSVCDYPFLLDLFRQFQPDAVVHYAEQPAAPYSMMGHKEAVFTLTNNLVSTLNLIHAVKEVNRDCHIVKLGTMGVYGTPNIDIEEGYLEVEHKGRRHRFLYPKAPGSLYHLTKAQDGDMLYFYCRTWDIRVTDLNQGPVYGIDTEESRQDERLGPIFNYDDIFGTVLNRFLVQAVAGTPLTVYGQGGQTRGYLNIMDTMACVELALLHPAETGQYRVFNQFVETFSVNDLANKVKAAGEKLGLQVTIQNIPNPRREAEEHYYNPAHTGLLSLGLKPHFLTAEMMRGMLQTVQKYKDNINSSLIYPKVAWQ